MDNLKWSLDVLSNWISKNSQTIMDDFKMILEVLGNKSSKFSPTIMVDNLRWSLGA